MGMVLGLVSIDDESIEKILVDPPLIWKALSPDDPEMYESERTPEKKPSWFAKLFGAKNEPEPIQREPVELSAAVEDIDLDKAWHGIHYLLTGTAWEGDPPLNFLVLGGKEVGDIDVGYGTARAFVSNEVDLILKAIEPISEDALESRFDGAEMTQLEIYPSIWDRDPSDDPVLEYCIEYFDTLKSFLRRTSERGLGMIIYIS